MITAGSPARRRLFTRHVALVAVLAAAPALAGEKNKDKKPDDKNSFLYTTATGDVTQGTVYNPGPFHVTGVIGLSTADYFRGVFDGVPEELDTLTAAGALRFTYEIPGEGTPLKDATLTAGSANNFWTDRPDEIAEDGAWYESDNFVGVATKLSKNTLGSLTYTAYTTPNGLAPSPLHEVALALQRDVTVRDGKVKLNPQVKAALPVDETDGLFLQARVAPTTTPFKIAGRNVSISAPLEAGLGVADYYGETVGTSGYMEGGLVAVVPLSDRSDFGEWRLEARTTATLRPDELADLSAADDGGNVVVEGGLAITFAY